MGLGAKRGVGTIKEVRDSLISEPDLSAVEKEHVDMIMSSVQSLSRSDKGKAVIIAIAAAMINNYQLYTAFLFWGTHDRESIRSSGIAEMNTIEQIRINQNSEPTIN